MINSKKMLVILLMVVFIASNLYSENVFALDAVAYSTTVTLTADFNGTHSNTVASSDCIKLNGYDLCTGGNAISGGDTGGYPASYAYDNNSGTTWGSLQSGIEVSGVAYIGYDFGTSRTIKRVTIIQHANTNFTIASVKLQKWNGLSWDDVETLTLTEDHSVQIFNISATASGTKWRLLANDNPTYACFVYEIEMMKDYSTSGTYTHCELDVSSGVISNDMKITYNKTIPADTSLSVEARVYNGTTWSDWTAKNSGDSLIPNGTNLTGYKVQWRANLSTSDSAVTPSLDDVTISNTSNIAVTGVSLNKSSTTIAVNNTETLVATVAPENASNKSVAWSSSNETVATVSSEGVVSAVSPGTAGITVTTLDGSFSATCNVTTENRGVTGISLKTSTTIGIGQTQALLPTITPADATNKSVTWSSNNTAIATVDANGTVTGLNQGTAIITVTTVDGGYTAICSVCVKVLSTYKIQYEYDANGNLISMTISET